MRNWTGAMAGRRLVAAIQAALQARWSIEWEQVVSAKDKIQQVGWSNRLLLFDKSPKFIKKSIDAILLDEAEEISNEPN